MNQIMVNAVELQLIEDEVKALRLRERSAKDQAGRSRGQNQNT
jgi:hypothetical protein